MHELYYWESFIEIPGREPEYFCSGHYFTETEPTENVDRFDDFDDFLKWSEATDMTGVKVYTQMFQKSKEITFFGIKFDTIVTRYNFKPGTTVRIKYELVSPKVRNMEYFKHNLSADDFFTFIRERFGDMNKMVIII